MKAERQSINCKYITVHYHSDATYKTKFQLPTTDNRTSRVLFLTSDLYTHCHCISALRLSIVTAYIDDMYTSYNR